MAKFNDKPHVFDSLLEYLDLDEIRNLERTIQNWRAKYPGYEELYIRFNKGYEGCGCGCGESPSLELWGVNIETPEQIQQRRQHWEELQVKKANKKKVIK